MLGYISEEEFNSRLAKIQRENESKERKRKLKEEKSKFKKKLKIETHKFLAFYLFVVFNIVLVYSMVAMWVLEDLAYLGVLITDIVAQILAYVIYCVKSYKGKKEEEQLKFEKEKLFNTKVNEVNTEVYEVDTDDFDNFNCDEAVG